MPRELGEHGFPLFFERGEYDEIHRRTRDRWTRRIARRRRQWSGHGSERAVRLGESAVRLLKAQYLGGALAERRLHAGEVRRRYTELENQGLELRGKEVTEGVES